MDLRDFIEIAKTVKKLSSKITCNSKDSSSSIKNLPLSKKDLFLSKNGLSLSEEKTIYLNAVAANAETNLTVFTNLIDLSNYHTDVRFRRQVDPTRNVFMAIDPALYRLIR